MKKLVRYIDESCSKLLSMSNMNNPGLFRSKVPRKQRFLRKDLPSTPHEAIKLLQKFGILPQVGPRGEQLEVRDFGTRGDSRNANLKFYEKGS